MESNQNNFAAWIASAHKAIRQMPDRDHSAEFAAMI
jgi:hypothetical protein